jgi:tetratricopeptide (TPR) repeat protein
MTYEEADLFTRTPIRQALKAYHDSPELGKHPLSSLKIVEERHRSAGRADTPIEYGQSLRRVLRAAIEELRPETGDPDLSSKRWRPYIILKREYIVRDDPEYVAMQLLLPDGNSISFRTYQVERAKAIDQLATILWEWEEGLRTIASTEPGSVPFLAPVKPNYQLVGRSGLLCRLKERLFAGDSVGPIALCGLPGAGKTALAVELAHDQEVLAHFTDGVLWAGLGPNPDILAHFGQWAQALGCTPEQLSGRTTVEERQELLRAAIGQRHMLIVVDDAWQPEEALAFQVGGVHCAHLMTSRQPNIGLDFAGNGLIPVGELELRDGIALLKELAPNVVASEREAAEDLVRAVDGLPLSLNLMGRSLSKAAYSGNPRRLRTALSRLREIRKRLDLKQPQAPAGHFPNLPAGMPVSVWAAVAASDETLSEPARRTFYALSVFPPKPNTFAEPAAVAVAAESVESLDELFDSGLLEGGGPGRYTLHQVMNDYAALKLDDEQAYTRMASFLIEYVKAHAREYDTLDLDRRNVAIALDTAFSRAMNQHFVKGVNAFCHYWWRSGLYTDAQEYLQRAEQTARSLDAPIGLITTSLNLAETAVALGDYGDAEAQSQEGLRIAQRPEHDEAISLLLANLGEIAIKRGDYPQAKEHLQQGLAIARGTQNERAISRLLMHLGAVAEKEGQYAQAKENWQESLAIVQDIEDHEMISALLTSLGTLAEKRGEPAEAEDYWERAMGVARSLRHRERICGLLISLGRAAARQKHSARAQQYWEKSVEMARDIGHREMTSHALANLGTIVERRGDPDKARKHWEESLEIARKIGHPERINFALTNLGITAANRGEFEEARRYFLEGRREAEKMGHTERICFFLNNLAGLAIDCGDYVQAEEYIKKGLPLALKAGNRESINLFLTNRGLIALERGDNDQAERDLMEALSIAHEVEDIRLVCNCLLGIGELRLKQQRPDEAFDAFLEVVKKGHESEDQEIQGRGRYGLGRSASIRGDMAEARCQGLESLTILESINHQQAAAVREWLATLPSEDQPN